MRVPHRVWLLLSAALLGPGAVRADLNCNVGIDFYDDGRVRGCVLNGNHHLYTRGGDAVTCADGERLEQHRDGSLASCTLAAPARLDGRDCPRGSEVVFAADGRLLHCKEKPTG